MKILNYQYSDSIEKFLTESETSILGKITENNQNHKLIEHQINAWKKQIHILKTSLFDLTGLIFFEFTIPRMGKRVDNIIIVDGKLIVLEFKVGENAHNSHDIRQTEDYALDLHNFHEGSHEVDIFPVLLATSADNTNHEIIIKNRIADVIKTNSQGLRDLVMKIRSTKATGIANSDWAETRYKPTPTIIEAAQALYKGHDVKEISRSDSGAINLSYTSRALNTIIDNCKRENQKAICFVTGVPGAGKTLAGLNIANERMRIDNSENSVFLSGNGPLVEVLREALIRDKVKQSVMDGEKITKTSASPGVKAFIQNIHHFRDSGLASENEPYERVVIFDEAQRAWNKKQVSKFMKTKKGREEFEFSEPEFLIHVMDRHKDWCVIVCLIGGGQEINTGEAGITEWVDSVKRSYPNWSIFSSPNILRSDNYVTNESSIEFLKSRSGFDKNLHLSTSIRSFRSEKLSHLIACLLGLNIHESVKTYNELAGAYEIFITRNILVAKNWLKKKKRGSERIGLLGSSEARRLRAEGLDVKNDINPVNWFLDDENDVRSSQFLEVIASQFDIQGLEIDWACICWGADLRLSSGLQWEYFKFKGTKWQHRNTDKHYLLNAYRVLLTRARQGMIIYVPEGDTDDRTRHPEYYNNTYDYLRRIGFSEK